MLNLIHNHRVLLGVAVTAVLAAVIILLLVYSGGGGHTGTGY